MRSDEPPEEYRRLRPEAIFRLAFESRPMSASLRLTALAVALSAAAPVTAHAMDDYVAAGSSAPTPIKLCGTADGARSCDADRQPPRRCLREEARRRLKG